MGHEQKSAKTFYFYLVDIEMNDADFGAPLTKGLT